MPNPDLIPEPFAQSGDKNTIPLKRAIADPIYRASWKAGFPPDTRLPKDLGGEGPDGLDFNGVLNILSQAVVFLQKGNEYQFDASMAPYPIGALVRSNDNLTTYQSTVPNNSNNPNSNMSGWRVYNGSGFIVDNLTPNDSAKALSAAQGKAIADAFTGTKSNNGYQKLYGGLIIQWGTTGSLNYNASLDISFPIPFPSACLNMVASPRAINTQSFSGSTSAYTSNVTNTGATLTNDSSSEREAFAITWMAIGY